MTFSFIDVKVPGETSQNNEPQMLNEALEPNAMAKAANASAKKAAEKRKKAMAKAGYKMEEVNIDDILSLDETSFDDYIEDMTIEELKELEEGIIGGTAKLVGKGIGAVAKGVGKGIGAVANRMSTAGRADAAERKLAKLKKKQKDRQRLNVAKKGIASLKMGTNEAVDPVDKKAVKKKFHNRKDKDIDNDGDVDSSDEYLHKRRKAISKATSKPTEDEPEGENGETAEMNPKMKDKKKMEKKESKIREALLSIFERGRLDNKDDYDEKFRGKGAKDMKKDHMKGDVDDTLKLAVKDVSDAGRRGPSPKARSGADKMNVGDKKIMKGGTPTPNQKMESLVQAYKSMKSI